MTGSSVGALVAMGAIVAVLAVMDWVAVWRESRTLRWLSKPGTLAALILAAMLIDPADSVIRRWFVVALALSLAGDVFLLLEEKWFPAGLGSFLLAHVAYIAGLFLAFASWPWLVAGLVLVTGVATVLGRRLVPAVAGSTPDLVGPVAAYMAVISIMVAMAFATGSVWAIAGAVLFYISDSVLAWDRFVSPLRMGPPAVMVTYHLAQASLVVSLLALSSG